MPYRKGSSSPTFWPSSLSTGTALSESPAKKKKRKRKAISVQYNTNSHATFPFRFVKIQTLFHKTDPTGTLNGLRSTKPREFILQGISTGSHAQPRAQKAPRLSLSIPRKYARYFRTRTKPLDPAALYRQNPKISGLKKPPRAATLAKNVRRSPASILRALTRNHNSSHAGNSFTRIHAPSSDKRTQFHDVMDDVTPTNRFDRPGNRTRS